MKKRFFTYIGLLFTAVSCIYPFNPELPDTVEHALVVEGNILLGDYSTAVFRYLQPLSGKVMGYPSGTAYIEDDGGTIYSGYTEADLYAQQGYTLHFDTRNASEDRLYRMVLTVDSHSYETDWIQPEVSPVITGVRFTADKDNVHALVSFTDAPGGSGYSSVTYEETWHFHADYLKTYYINLATYEIIQIMGQPDYLRYWCWKSYESSTYSLVDSYDTHGHVEDFEFNSFLRTNNRNHDRYRVKVKVKSMPETEYKFRKLLNDNDEIGGNLFTPEPGEIAGNLICSDDPSVKVYGYVGAARVAEGYFYMDDSFYINYTYPLIKVESMEDYPRYLDMGYEPITDYFYNGESIIGWGQKRCYDCTAAGGTQVEPENWEK